MSEDILQLALRLRDMYRQIDAESHPARVIDALAAEMVSFRTKNARLREALQRIIRLSEETDELVELSAKEIIEALANCEQTARTVLKETT